MDPDKYQLAWQAQSAQTRVTIHADLLLKEVRRHQQDFQSTIFWRDFREVGAALMMLPIWVYMGVAMALPWTWYLTMPVLVWNVVFLLTYRVRRRQKPVVSGGPLIHCVKDSLAQVEDQIWLNRNYFWWSLLPFSVSVLTFVFHLAWLSEDWPDALGHLGIAVFIVALYCGIHYKNKKYGCLPYEQRRQELLTLLSSLSDETDSPNANDADSVEIVPASVSPFSDQSFVTPRTSPAKLAIGFFGLVAAALLLVAGVYFVADYLPGGGYPKKSPFAAVRWQESQPEVQLGEEWFMLLSLDEIPASEIVAFSQRTYGDLWRKRFEEDLVELLTRMGHPPQDTVTLLVQSLTSGEQSVRESVPMTRANRAAIRNAAVQERVISDPPRQDDKRTGSSADKLPPLVELFESIVHPGQTVDDPHEPEFDDVSAVGEGDISQVDAWLQEQVALTE